MSPPLSPRSDGARKNLMLHLRSYADATERVNERMEWIINFRKVKTEVLKTHYLLRQRVSHKYPFKRIDRTRPSVPPKLKVKSFKRLKQPYLPNGKSRSVSKLLRFEEDPVNGGVVVHADTSITFPKSEIEMMVEKLTDL